MKLKTKLTAMATVVGLVAASAASAVNFGRVWVGDQAIGKLYIYNQSGLNSSGSTTPDIIDLASNDLGTPAPLVNTKMHLVGFNNVPGIHPKSRATLNYLGGDWQVWTTTPGSEAPVFQDHASTNDSLHMCAGNPTNDQIACANLSSSAPQLIFYDADYNTDTYDNKQNVFLNTDLTIDPSVGPAVVAQINQAIAEGVLEGRPTCTNYDTTGKFVYITLINNPNDPANTNTGVMILNTQDTSNVTIMNAFGSSLTTTTGCGLVNSPDGKFMWTNVGSTSDTDVEAAFKWKNSRIGKANVLKATVTLPQTAEGDVHGAQFLGLGGSFLWELMRLDHTIHVLKPGRNPRIVNTIDLVTPSLPNPAGDVLDRSQFGTRAYLTLRGFAPITAITAFPDPDRDPGVMVMKTLFGFGGSILKVESIRSTDSGPEILVPVCPADDGDDHSHTGQDCFDENDDPIPGTLFLDAADPHGLKTLNFLTGGF